MINKSAADQSKGKFTNPLIINDHVFVDQDSAKKKPELVGIRAHTSSYVDEEEVQSPFRLKK